jgi:glyoxylase I family protein
MDIPPISGFGHIDLTVTDVERSREWWERVMGFSLVNVVDKPEYTIRTMLHPCGVAVTLMGHSRLATDRFDERAVGLDHFALRVPERASLEAWAEHLDALGIEHSGIQDEIGGPLIVLRDPDNIQLEVWAFDPDQVTVNRS